MLFSPLLARKETYHSEYLDEDIVDLLGATFDIPRSYSFAIVPIEDGYDGRADLIADAIYNDEMYQEILTRVNGPGNPFEMISGQIMVVPTTDMLDDFIQEPAKEWSEQYLAKQAAKPKPKARNEKRKPNEAVIGDKRFNIDTQSKIIIY